jgi:hypothetical protein
MLVPRFSIRTYFVATLVVAPLFVAFGYALEGRTWAVAIMTGVGALAAAFAVYALFFAIAWLFVERRLAIQKPSPQSPFATDLPPQQVLPPVDT